MRRRLADMGEKARYLCQNRKISRMRWVLGTLVGFHRFLSAPMDVGRRPKTIAIEENLWNPLGTRLFNIDRTGTQCSLILTLTQPLLPWEADPLHTLLV